MELHLKTNKRLSILGRVDNALWEFEGRMWSIAIHALIESVVNCGLAMFGSHRSKVR